MSHVVVIGGGFAGLGASAALASRGYQVTLLEAGPDVGGKAAAIDVAGARVDVGPTILTDLAPLRALFTTAGARLEDVVSLAHLDPSLVATFPGARRLALFRDPDTLAAELATLGHDAGDDWKRLLDLGARAARLAGHYYASGDVAGPRDLVRFLQGGSVALTDAVAFARPRSLARLVAAHIRTPELARLLGHCARFIGLDADRAPSVALVIPYLLATAGVAYPLGGFTAVVDAVRDLAVKHAVRIETGATVSRLEIAGRRFVAAITADGRRVAGDACVAAVDVDVTARWLDASGRARASRPAYAARVAWWVIEGAPRQRIHHAFHFAGDPHPAYVAVPTVTDPGLAPAGASIVYSLLHGRPGMPAGPAFAEEMRARLVRAAVWPAGRVLAQGVAGGAESCYGGAIGPGLFASFRPSPRTGVANLVRAGGTVFPGPGIANVLRSALRAAALIVARVQP